MDLAQGIRSALTQMAFHLGWIVNIDNLVRVHRGWCAVRKGRRLVFRCGHDFGRGGLQRGLVGSGHVVHPRAVVGTVDVRFPVHGAQAAAQDVVLGSDTAGLVGELLTQVASVFPGDGVKTRGRRVLFQPAVLTGQGFARRYNGIPHLTR